MPPPSQILELVERFRRNLALYKRDDYKDARLRVEFVDPFFEAIGWDVRDVHSFAEQYKDVVHEDALRIRGQPTPRTTASASAGRASSFWKDPTPQPPSRGGKGKPERFYAPPGLG